MSAYKPLLIIKTGNTIATLKARGLDFEDWFRAGCGLRDSECRTVSLFLGEPLPALDEVGAIIVTGSPAFVTDLEPWNHVGARYLRQAHEQNVPILGVCYGHQLLAWAFAGEVDFNPAGRQIGTVALELTAAGARDALLAPLAAHPRVQVSHLQSVLALPPGAELLASRKEDPNHAFRMGDSTWGVQFHPEFSAEVTRAYIKERRAVLTEEELEPNALLKSVSDTPQAVGVLKRFVAHSLQRNVE
ncbi:MAG: glutamine amidotransferase [Pseudohongiellaceae bacterium]